MRSYLNRIPLPLDEIRRIKKSVDAITRDTFYGSIKTQNLEAGVKQVFEEPMERYLA